MKFTLDIKKLQNTFGNNFTIIDPEKEYADLMKIPFENMDSISPFPVTPIADDSETDSDPQNTYYLQTIKYKIGEQNG